jgi:tRNA pseudouridine55 synthase
MAMSRRNKKGTPVHGWVIVDKPEGITSTQVVGIVKRVFDAQKAGHAGTLDPMATGVLAVALGEATKTVAYAMDAEKSYRFTACWGEARDSDDAEGAVTATSDKRPTRDEIEARIGDFVGTISQVPPAYSAIKVQGERAYDLARDGETVALEPRTIEIHEARLVEQPDPDHAVFEMLCGKGAYVRAWVRDLALSLGTVGHVSQLRRTSVGSFTAEAAIPLEKLKAFMHIPAAFEHLRPISTALDGIPALAVTGPDAVRLRSGNSILVRANQFARLTEETEPGDDLQGLTVFLSTNEGEPVALAALEAGELRPFRVFNFGV